MFLAHKGAALAGHMITTLQESYTTFARSHGNVEERESAIAAAGTRALMSSGGASSTKPAGTTSASNLGLSEIFLCILNKNFVLL